MNVIARLLVLALAVATPAVASSSNTRGNKGRDKIAEAKAFFEQVETAVEGLMNDPSCDSSKLAGFFADDAVLLAPISFDNDSDGILEGKEAIQAYYKGACEAAYIVAGGVPFVFSVDQHAAWYDVVGNTAIHYGASNFDVTYSGGTDFVTELAHFTVIAQKDRHGNYKITSDNQSTMVDVPGN
jgi:TRAP-type mannitol/chloroaromatic compound transport system substrate-binding protein